MSSPAFGWGKRGLPYTPALPLTGWNKSLLNGLIFPLGLCCFCLRGKFQFPCRDKGSCEPWRQRPWMAAVFSARASHVPQNNWCLWLLQAAAAHWTSTKGLYHLWEKILKRNTVFSLKFTFFFSYFLKKSTFFVSSSQSKHLSTITTKAMACLRMKSSWEMSLTKWKLQLSHAQVIKKWGQLLQWKSIFMTKSFMHIKLHVQGVLCIQALIVQSKNSKPIALASSRFFPVPGYPGKVKSRDGIPQTPLANPVL